MSTFNILKIISNYLSFFFTRNNELPIFAPSTFRCQGLEISRFWHFMHHIFPEVGNFNNNLIGVEFIHVLYGIHV
jgi:hypothetical protein